MPFILIAEDDRPTRNAMVEYFRSRGYRVSGVPNAERALDTVEGCLPDLIISDCNLGLGMDGLDLARRLRSLGCSAPVLFVTGLPLGQLAYRAQDLNSVSFVQKPATLTTLRTKVCRLLEDANDD